VLKWYMRLKKTTLQRRFSMIDMKYNEALIRVTQDRVAYLESKGWVRVDAADDETPAEAEETDESLED